MEQPETYRKEQPDPHSANYWPSVLIVGGIFSVIGFLVNIIFGYMQIESEPTGSMMSPAMLGSVAVCLATCLGGLIAVRHFAKNVTPYMKLGRGALIGFLTGVVIVVFSSLLNELWLILDPDYTQRVFESIVENIEQMPVPEETRDQLIDQMAAGVQETNIFQQILFGVPLTGLLNLLTGMLGVKLFAEKEEETI